MPEDNSLEFLPSIPPMPKPPQDIDDLEAWQAHIQAIDAYLLDLNEAIQKIETGDFIKKFKQRLHEKNIDLDTIKLPQSVMEDIAKKMQSILELSEEMGRTAPPAGLPKNNRRAAPSKRNINPI